jgi:hypothetical protein
MRTARELLRQGRERCTSPFHDFRLSRGVTWLEPTLTVELTYSELMEGRLRDPVYRSTVRASPKWLRVVTRPSPLLI